MTSQITVNRERLVAGWFESYREELTGYAAQRLGSSGAADAVSEAFARALASDQEVLAPRAWLYGCLVNIIFEARRRERRQFQLLNRIIRDGTFRGSLVDDARQSVSPAFVAALRALPRLQRETLLLHVWGELSYEECSEALGVPLGTVKSRIARARETLGRTLPQEHDD